MIRIGKNWAPSVPQLSSPVRSVMTYSGFLEMYDRIQFADHTIAVKFIRYLNEGHGILKKSTRRDVYTYTCKEVHNCPFKIRLRPEIGVLNSGCSEGRNQYYRVSEAIRHNRNAQDDHLSKDHALLVEITRKKRELEILHNRVEALCELIKKKYNRQIKNHRSELRRKLEKIAKLEK